MKDTSNYHKTIDRLIKGTYGNVIALDKYEILDNESINVSLKYVSPIELQDESKDEYRVEYVILPGIGEMILNKDFSIQKKTNRLKITANVEDKRRELVYGIEDDLVKIVYNNLSKDNVITMRFNPVHSILTNIVREKNGLDLNSFRLSNKKNLKYINYCKWLEEADLIYKSEKRYYPSTFITVKLEAGVDYSQITSESFAKFVLYMQEEHNDVLRSASKLKLDIMDLIYYKGCLMHEGIKISTESLKNSLEMLLQNRATRQRINDSAQALSDIGVIETNNKYWFPVDEYLRKLIDKTTLNSLTIYQTTLS